MRMKKLLAVLAACAMLSNGSALADMTPGTYEGVDGIAGCTVTSNAILQAAQMAFEAASGTKAYEDYLAEQEKASK